MPVRRPALAIGTLAVVLAATSACATPLLDPGTDATETRDVTGATGVRLETVGRLVVREGDAATLTVTAGDRVLPRLETDVRDGVLVIDMRRTWGNLGTPEYVLEVPDVDRVELDGAGSVVVEQVRGDELVVRLDGAGQVRLEDVEVDRLDASIAGTGTVLASGSATEQVVRLSGAGDHRAADLRSDAVVVELSGAGSARVHADATLDVDLSGAGAVRYSGDPEVTSSVDGAGRVERE